MSPIILTRILAGVFDDDLRAWAQAVKEFRTPIIVEYGTEINGDWFSWNGMWNGAGTTDGYGDTDNQTEDDGGDSGGGGCFVGSLF